MVQLSIDLVLFIGARQGFVLGVWAGWEETCILHVGIDGWIECFMQVLARCIVDFELWCVDGMVGIRAWCFELGFNITCLEVSCILACKL